MRASRAEFPSRASVTRTSRTSMRAPPSSIPRATVGAPLSFSTGLMYVKYRRRFSVNLGCSARSWRPPSPFALTSGTPLTGFGSSIPLRTTRSRPGRSVTSMLPSGRKAKPQGWTSPRVTIVTRILCCSAVSNTNGPAPSGATGTPMGGCWPWAMTTVANSSGIVKQTADRRTNWSAINSIEFRLPGELTRRHCMSDPMI